MKTISNGSKVMWSGAWGEDSAKEATIESIEQTENEHEKYGWEVESINWKNGKWEFPFVCTLDNGHWAYSYQVKPM